LVDLNRRSPSNDHAGRDPEEVTVDDHAVSAGDDSRSAQLDLILKGLGNLFSGAGSVVCGLTDAKIRSGLQEALKVGSVDAVVQSSTVDGFLRKPGNQGKLTFSAF
jgi:hypothetical protein